jgi:hypothetical protein
MYHYKSIKINLLKSEPTTVMIGDYKEYAHIQQKIRNMSVKEGNLNVSTLNQ